MKYALIFCLLVSRSFAATFYVDFSAGSDSNTSTQAQSQSTPWKHAPGMDGATSNANSYSMASGDVFVLKGGSTWTPTNHNADIWTLGANNITIQGGQRLGTPWGSGYPVLDGSGATITIAAIVTSGRTGVTVDGISMINQSLLKDGSGSGVYAVGGSCANYEIKNCSFNNTGSQSIFVSPTVSGGSSFLIHDNVILNTGRIFGLFDSGISYDNFQLYSNAMGGPGTWDGNSFGIGSGGTGYTLNDVLAIVQSGHSGATVKVTGVSSGAVTSLQTLTKGAPVYDQTNGNSTTGGTGSGCTIDIGGYHADGIIIGSACNADPSTLTNVLIYNNKFSGDWSQGGTALIFLNDGGGSSSFTQGGGYHAKIYNNQLCMDSKGWVGPACIYITNGWRDVQIFNNTINAVTAGGKANGFAIGEANNTTAMALVIKNNFLSGCTWGFQGDDVKSGSGLTMDYNIYQTTGNNNYLQDSTGSGAAMNSLGAMQANGYEAHGQVVTSAAALGFTTLPNGTNGVGVWTLQSGSPAIDAGVDLSATLSALSTDLIGTARPQGAGWDIGAFEYTSGAVLAVPTNYRKPRTMAAGF